MRARSPSGGGKGKVKYMLLEMNKKSYLACRFNIENGLTFKYSMYFYDVYIQRGGGGLDPLLLLFLSFYLVKLVLNESLGKF